MDSFAWYTDILVSLLVWKYCARLSPRTTHSSTNISVYHAQSIQFISNLVSSMYEGIATKVLTVRGWGVPVTPGVKNVKQCSKTNKTWSEEALMLTLDNDDLHGVQRSSEVKCSKLWVMAIKLGQENLWWISIMMMTFMEVKDHQRSNIVTMSYGY